MIQQWQVYYNGAVLVSCRRLYSPAARLATGFISPPAPQSVPTEMASLYEFTTYANHTSIGTQISPSACNHKQSVNNLPINYKQWRISSVLTTSYRSEMSLHCATSYSASRSCGSREHGPLPPACDQSSVLQHAGVDHSAAGVGML